MGTTNINKNNEQSKRKGILKKAALLATVASITSAAAIGNQKPKESEALIGAIFGVISTVIGVATGIGQGVAETVAQRNARKQAEEEARRQAEEEKRRAEEERMRQLLETSSDHNVRLSAQEEEDESKVINISVADNTSLQGAQSAQSMRSKGNLQKPSSPPKGIHVGGFGAVEEDDTQIENIVTENEVLDESVYDEMEDTVDIVDNELINEIVNDVVDENINVKEEIDTVVEESKQEETQTQNKEEAVVVNISTNKNTNVLNKNTSKSEVINLGSEDTSNVIRLEINEKDEDDDILYEEIIIKSGTNNKEEATIGVSDDMLMSTEDAEKHYLVIEGYLSADDLILLDFGIRSGAITEDVLEVMHENGDISDEYYDAGLSLIEEMNDSEMEN